jgi:dihydroceramide fatty acyl 2-hydroxylase
MIEIGDGLDLAIRARQAGSASRSLLSDLSKSRANYWAAYTVDFTCPVLFAYLGLRHHPSWLSIFINSAIGLVVFSLVEYCVHRWLLHNPKSVFFPLHEAHHNQPEATAAGLFPTSFLILMPVWLLLTYGLHWQGGSFFLCGLSAGNFYFDSLHNLEHTTRINQIPFRWLQGRWAAHSVHHRLDRTNFGVMTSFWDYVFGTHQKQAKRKSPGA